MAAFFFVDVHILLHRQDCAAEDTKKEGYVPAAFLQLKEKTLDNSVAKPKPVSVSTELRHSVVYGV